MDLLSLLDELRILATNGLRYADDPHDERRYGRILDLVSECYGETLELPAPEVRERLGATLGHVTPNVGSEAAVFDDEDRLLLTRRADDGSWCLPGGFVEPGESPAETAVRETREETGLEVRVDDLVGVRSRPPDEHSPHGHVAVLYRCVVEGGTLEASRETETLAFRAVTSVSNWHRDHRALARDARESLTGSG